MGLGQGEIALDDHCLQGLHLGIAAIIQVGIGDGIDLTSSVRRVAEQSHRFRRGIMDTHIEYHTVRPLLLFHTTAQDNLLSIVVRAAVRIEKQVHGLDDIFIEVGTALMFCFGDNGKRSTAQAKLDAVFFPFNRRILAPQVVHTGGEGQRSKQRQEKEVYCTFHLSWHFG